MLGTIAIITPPPIHRGPGIVSDRFLCFFDSKITRENGWTDLHEIFRKDACGVTMGRPDYILVNSEKPRDAAMRNTGAGFVVL